MGCLNTILGGDDWQSLGRDILTGHGGETIPGVRTHCSDGKSPLGQADPWEGRALGCKMPVGMVTDHWDGKRLGWEGCLGTKSQTIASLGERG